MRALAGQVGRKVEGRNLAGARRVSISISVSI
jgi:hypothetical protein